MPDFNLRISADICHHPNPTEGGEITNEQGLYVCRDCGSKFPLTGDTDHWADGVRIVIHGVRRTSFPPESDTIPEQDSFSRKV